MRIRRVLTALFLVLALVFSSCKDNLFDFNLQNVEADGEWGFPLLNKTVYVDDLLHNLDSMVFFNNSGVLTFVAENEVKNVVSLQRIFKIDDKVIDTSGIEDITHLPEFDLMRVVQFNLNTEDFILKYAEMKSGSMSLTFNINSANFVYSAMLTTDNILSPQGDALTLQFSDSIHTQNVDFSNYIIEPNAAGYIVFAAHVTVPNSVSISQIEYSGHVELTNFAIHSVTGQFKAIPFSYGSQTAFKFHFDEFHFDDIQFNNAKVSVFSQNSICRVDGSLNDVHLYGPNGANLPLISSPLNFSIPISPYQYVFVTEANIPTISYSPNYDSLGLQCDFNVNPEGLAAGNITVNENSTMNLKFRTELPANISINNAVYNDTLDNALYQQLNISEIQSIEKLTLRIALSNAFPFDLIPRIEFMDSHTGNKYCLNIGENHIYGSYNGIPYQHQPIFIEVSSDDAKKIINADKIILNFRLNTQGHNVEITDSQFVKASIGAKIKYSTINL